MKAILQAIGFGTLATAIIGGIVIAVSLVDHRVDKSSESPIDISTEEPKRPSNQPTVMEKAQYLGWTEIDEETFESRTDYRHEYLACYCSMYDDGYMELLIAKDLDNDEFDVIVIEPWRVNDQSYIPVEYTYVDSCYINNKTKQAWSVKVLSYNYLGGYMSYREEAAR